MRYWGMGPAGAVFKGSVASFALFLLSATIPVLALPAGALVPFPAVYYRIKNGRATGYAIVALMICSLALLDRDAMHLYLLQSVACSLLLPEFLSRGKGGFRSILYVACSNALIVACYAVVLALFLNIDLDGHVRNTLHDAMGLMSETFRQSGMAVDELKELEAPLSRVEELLVSIYPSLILVYLGLVAGINVLLVKRVSRLLGRDLSIGEFTNFRNPDALVWMLIVPGFAMLAGVDAVDRLALNLLVPALVLYLIQGAAIVTWFSGKHSIPRFVVLFFFLLLLLQPIIAAAVSAFGLFDLWADFRAPKKTENL